MGKLKEFSIQLDNYGAVYTSGEVVSGHVVVDINAPMKMRGIRVTFLGRSGVNWRETQGQSDNTNTNPVIIHFNAEEVYLNYREILWGQDSDCDFTGFLPARRYEFPFKVFLPKDLPCSFEGDHGCINYKINATIDKPWKKDHNVKRFFTVLGMYDLNDDPIASEAIVHTASRRVCCGCCTGGSFSLRYTIDRRGFVPGEEIPLVIEVKNNSRCKLRSEVKFKMVTTYFAHDDSKKQQEELERFDMDPVSAHSSGTWRTSVDIPPTPPSHLLGCNIIDVNYIIRLKVTPDGCNCDGIDFHDEILVGTVPLRHVIAKMFGDAVLAEALMGRSSSDLGTKQDVSSNDIPGAKQMPEDDGYDDIAFPTPVYAKGRKNSVLDDDDHKLTGEGGFTPQYTFYNWKQMLVRLKEDQDSKGDTKQPKEQTMYRGFGDVVEGAVAKQKRVTENAVGVFLQRARRAKNIIKEEKSVEETAPESDKKPEPDINSVQTRGSKIYLEQRTVSFADDVIFGGSSPEGEHIVVDANRMKECPEEAKLIVEDSVAAKLRVECSSADTDASNVDATKEYLKKYRLSDPNRDDDVHPMLQGRYSTYC